MIPGYRTMGDPDWAEGVARAIEDHHPDREPYASMSREEIYGLMKAMEKQDDATGYDYEVLNQHLLDKFTHEELKQANLAEKLTNFLIKEREAWGNEQCVFIHKIAIEVAQKLFREMPAPGPAHEVN